jgi:hypothetical protein
MSKDWNCNLGSNTVADMLQRWTLASSSAHPHVGKTYPAIRQPVNPKRNIIAHGQILHAANQETADIRRYTPIHSKRQSSRHNANYACRSPFG